MVAMGFMGDKKELGLEASGVVHRVGPQVKHLRVGDRVMVVGNGLFCSRKIVSEDCCFALSPDLGLSLEDAATLPSVQSTVFYSLLRVANIRKGQSILIHSACGGVGLAAIQLCQQLGVEVRFLFSSFGKGALCLIASTGLCNSRKSSKGRVSCRYIFNP